MSLIFRSALPAALMALAALASAASAQTVQDGNFEAADPTQTTQTDYFATGTGFDTNWTVTGQVGIDNQDSYVFDGSKSLFLNSGLGTDSITQNIATDPTQFYTLSFFANDDVPGDQLFASFGGLALSPVSVVANGYTGANSTAFTEYVFSGLTTASAFSALSLSSVGSLSSGTLEVDNISLSSSPVPETSTSVSLGLLLMLGLGAVFASKKKSASVNA